MNNVPLIYKRYSKKRDYEIEIPRQIRNITGIRLIKIRKDNKKRPAEKHFLTENNYEHGDLAIEGWVRGGGNYAVLTGLRNDQGATLIVFDADELQRLEELGVLSALPATLTIQTGGGGQHRWFWGEGIEGKRVFYDQVEKDEDGEFRHLADLQHKGQYVIGPGSKHDSGRKYEIILDLPIAPLTAAQLDKATSCLRTKKKEVRKITITRREATSGSQSWRDEVRIEDICRPKNAENRGGGEVVGENPIHNHRHRKDEGKPNFAINTVKNVWSCYSCGSGGGWLEWLAVQEGIIRCSEAGPGCLSKDDFKELMERAEEKGLIQEKRSEKRAKLEGTVENTTECTTLDIGSNDKKDQKIEPPKEVRRTVVDKLPYTAPNIPLLMIKAPPREGKTHAAINWMVQEREGNYITSNHAIIQHAVNIIREMKGDKVVWVEGKKREGMCRNLKNIETCATCIMKPDNHKEGNIGYYELVEKARKLLNEKKILTKENIPLDMCPYFTLKCAEPFANYCFTVVQNINSIKRRSLEVIDEDTTIQYFYNQPVELCETRNMRGKAGWDNKMTKLDSIINSILKDGKQPGMKRYAVILRKITDILEEKGKNDIDGAAEDITALLKDFVPGKKYIQEENIVGEDDISFIQCVNCLNHLYAAQPVAVSKGIGGYRKLFLLGDGRTPTVNMEWWNEREEGSKVVTIGAKTTEMFTASMGGEIIEIQKFKFAKNFILVILEDKDKNVKKGTKTEIRRRMTRVLRELGGTNKQNGIRYPSMVLTGNKRNQHTAKENIGIANESTVEREDALKSDFTDGKPVIIYQSSMVSRGIDADCFNVMFVMDANFAQPFWFVVDEDIANEMIADETTNSVLRISPTARRNSDNAKLVIMRAEEARNVKYIQDCKMVVTVDEKELSAILKKTGVCGKVEAKDGVTSVVSWGTKSDGFYAKLFEMTQNPDAVRDDDEINSISAMISNVLREHKTKWTTTSDVQRAIGRDIGIIKSGLNKLYYDGRILLKTTNATSRWKPR